MTSARFAELEHVFVGVQARRVLAVGQHDDAAAPDLLRRARAHALQLFERDVQRVVERRRAAGARVFLIARSSAATSFVNACPNRRAACRSRRPGRGRAASAAARSPTAASCATGIFRSMLMLESSTSERAMGCGSCAKFVISCAMPSSKTWKSALRETGDELARAVLDRHAQEDEIGAAAEDLLRGDRQRQRGGEADRDDAIVSLAGPARRQDLARWGASLRRRASSAGPATPAASR